jgi:antirestriction protein ArdC
LNQATKRIFIMTASSFATTIADFFINAIESGDAKVWRAPWKQTFANGGLQVSAISKRPYAGANQFMLTLIAGAMGFTSNQWITKKQADEHFLVLKEDQVPTTITKFFRGTKKVEGEIINEFGDTEQVEGKVSMAGYVAYQVYNLSQFSNKLSKFTKNESTQTDILREYTPNEMADLIIENSQIKIVHGGTGAYFDHITNTVHVPDRNNFASCEHYYATVFHEMIHATGPKLGRKLGNKFGDQAYAIEELIAEIGSSILMGMCGLDYPHILDNHIAYLQSWVKAIKEKKTNIIIAANAAYQAFEYITGYSETIS